MICSRRRKEADDLRLVFGEWFPPPYAGGYSGYGPTGDALI